MSRTHKRRRREDSQRFRSNLESLDLYNALILQVEQWTGEIKHNLTSAVAENILRELVPGGVLNTDVSKGTIAGGSSIAPS